MSGSAPEQLKKWILDRHPEVPDIEPDFDLLENRLIDSLAFVEFMLLVSRLSGEDIDMEDIDIDDFRTLHRIEERYFRAGVL
ncbi:acyl carrier protein [Streptantibioticus rubrisoli]|uniref:Acyl carrier protein n=1 Tax=Streptantibioticus rubrisoli TaxID=1387313 RepID=A0ABT1P7Y9_9ACTN|nr:acyl carrier protein [Streptantibioticus rubrisoli]MCQ4041489.1 acyl carrier protein [Streptantibioticus rubrisoli]